MVSKFDLPSLTHPHEVFHQFARKSSEYDYWLSRKPPLLTLLWYPPLRDWQHLSWKSCYVIQRLVFWHIYFAKSIRTSFALRFFFFFRLLLTFKSLFQSGTRHYSWAPRSFFHLRNLQHHTPSNLSSFNLLIWAYSLHFIFNISC